ncbi:conserved hypothetical protein [Leishmania infantum JPCM5]|uniref:Emp24/gp25L/p24_family/GOLD_-_putative n=3 Tax=Leishmania donovani species complex TaxID=38574 RepID=A0A6L0XVS6_LEIIN|nr:conserved hypothetical protein [Leishmania infantum JPCM5]CAC9518671.1 emp24/gp25L/p24_family/GOLD_-_putative [Leishmania infantum]CAM70463.1 conserved hypothetical protein [Leishmania infantum JPCM5]SUZ44325.1 emp24/gp25L/p24_family/GOLD_-_putative [Leishmania infantum]|eukprot:XP_001467405.1 conserved hypothetical protein [Leishmania infantum JPCM5]
MKRHGALLSVSVLVLLVAALVATAAAPASAIAVGVEATEVFSVTDIVPPGNNLVFAFYMNPDFVFPVRIRCRETGDVLQAWKGSPQGYLNLPSTDKTRHLVFEFDNSQSLLTLSSVSFEIRVIPDPTRGVRKEEIDPIEKKVQTLFEKMQTLRKLQELIRYNQKDHRALVEHANERVHWWSIMQVVSFFVAAGGQLWLLRSFVEKRRTI